MTAEEKYGKLQIATQNFLDFLYQAASPLLMTRLPLDLFALPENTPMEKVIEDATAIDVTKSLVRGMMVEFLKRVALVLDEEQMRQPFAELGLEEEDVAEIMVCMPRAFGRRHGVSADVARAAKETMSGFVWSLGFMKEPQLVTVGVTNVEVPYILEISKIEEDGAELLRVRRAAGLQDDDGAAEEEHLLGEIPPN